MSALAKLMERNGYPWETIEQVKQRKQPNLPKLAAAIHEACQSMAPDPDISESDAKFIAGWVHKTLELDNE